MQLFGEHDGANYQARAVLAVLSARSLKEMPENSWERPRVERWFNCREQGYVIFWHLSGKQLNIAFFRHRNSDWICAVEWEQGTINPPTIETMETRGKVYNTKWETSKDVKPGQYDEMADWIMERLEAFAEARKPRKPEAA